MFPNLLAEMTRSKKYQNDLAELLKLNKTTISYKMNGKTDFNMNECKTIQKEWFPNKSLDYLFNLNEESRKE